ncbi:MAG: serine protease, partial [Chlamydiota bacterium]|nr:serine protease [Chlamydiota bacterium]
SFDQNQIVKSTVKLACFKDQTTVNVVGSGTIISSDGVILTNRHVVEGTIGCLVGFQNSIDDAEVDYKEYKEIADISKISDDKNIDIALLKIRNPDSRQYSFVDISSSPDYKFKSLERIYIYGYPVYLTSAKQSQLTYSEQQQRLLYSNMTATHGIYAGNFFNKFLKTDAKIEQGNSGGGAYAENGTFVGVPTAGLAGNSESLGLILSNQKINQWLQNSKISVSNLSAAFSSVLASVDMKSIKVDYVDMSSVRISIYSSISMQQLLPNIQGYIQDAPQPLFQIRNTNNIDGYYVYFGPDITADPAITGTFISTNDYSPASINNDGTYYFIIKAKKGDAVSSTVITEYKYKKAPPKKTEEKKDKTTGQTIASRLRGNILLQVESNGEAYYVNPNNEKRYFLGRPADAFQIMRELGLGASHDFITKHIKGILPDNVIGKILIDVGDSGKAYYIYPKNKKPYYLGRPADAFKVMRELGLGISNSDLEKIAAH